MKSETEKFDAIVISGDLSQHAGPAEYAALLAFLRDKLVPEVTDRLITSTTLELIIARIATAAETSTRLKALV